ncbi:hypothetical protein ACIPJK_39355 [Streptomyces roseus]|uniref:hypothetical protein n=1 Tax=Streptomyces roseus TaxID=66430 RepID=UPI003811806A
MVGVHHCSGQAHAGLLNSHQGVDDEFGSHVIGDSPSGHLLEFLRAVTAVEFADDGAVGDVEGGEEACRR